MKKLNKLTIAEYIAIEQKDNLRYEFHNGAIYAMAGGSINHGLIIANTQVEVGRRLLDKDSSCFPLNNDVKLHIKSENKFLYPDIMLVCDDLVRSDAYGEAITNPTVIIEVLSKSTANYDRGDKFYFYRQTPNLQAYILIEQDKPLIEIYTQQSGLWEINRAAGLEGSLPIASLGLDIPLSAVYRNVVFPPVVK